ncbi:hypothetical protein GALMADRAFT_216737 [Galerina marginata CBS 339.88]|uniref:Uncharacterized protein n=1 Tax=Galerina marginata (strain CBS 339.88) TaxID=685588 RepID=A0A067SA88_GALM3|nr:hypothetical protein GALMADRAFT_216737 [Galerina marginata CBS 339.88]
MDNWEFPEFPFPIATIVGSTANLLTQTPAVSNVQEEPEESGYSADSDDPRNAIRRPAQRQPKSAKVNLLHRLVRDFLREGKFIPAKKSSVLVPELPSGPSTVIAEAYINRRHSGPSVDNLQFDWKLTMDHEWNARALQLLNNKFILYLKEEHLIDLVQLLGHDNISDSADVARLLSEITDIEKLFYNKLKSRRSKLKTGIKKVNMMPNASRNEIEEKFQRDYAEENRRSRRYERKKNLYIRRGETIIQKLQSVLQAGDRELWASIQIIFAHLNREDISSDETEVEDMFGSPKIVRRIRKAWLAPVVSKVMNFVDSQYCSRNPNGSVKRGAAPLRREWTSKSINTLSQPKPFLPRNFYSTEIVAEVMATLLPKPEVRIPGVPEPQSLLAQYQHQAPTADVINPELNESTAMDTH